MQWRMAEEVGELSFLCPVSGKRWNVREGVRYGTMGGSIVLTSVDWNEKMTITDTEVRYRIGQLEACQLEDGVAGMVSQTLAVLEES